MNYLKCQTFPVEQLDCHQTLQYGVGLTHLITGTTVIELKLQKTMNGLEFLQ